MEPRQRPEAEHHYEAGLQSNLIRNRLHATLSLFDLTRSNVVTSDTLAPRFYILSGKQRSQGAE